MRIAPTVVLALALLPGCGLLRYAEFPPPAAVDEVGDVQYLAYLRYPGDGARGISLVPTVRWDRERLARDLGVPRRVAIQIATADGQLVYRVEGGPDGGQWLVRHEAVRMFSRPEGAVLQADPAYAARGRLDGSKRYVLSLAAEGERGKRVHELAWFETEEAPPAVDEAAPPAR